jgi:hypothetical protein
MALKVDLNKKENSIPIFPDMSTCRAEHTNLSNEFVYCLVDKPVDCKYAEPFREKTCCFHPHRWEIVARTKVCRV